MALTRPPVARATMLIRRPVAEVFEAFVDPTVTTRFWFTRSSGRLVPGATVTWYWDQYGVSGEVAVTALEPGRRLAIAWPTPVEWTFSPRGADATFVSIEASGFTGTDDEQVAQALDSTEGFNLVIAACKALLEHGIELRLVPDKHPDASSSGSTQGERRPDPGMGDGHAAPTTAQHDRDVPLLIQPVAAADVPMDLLLLADPSEDKVLSYLSDSACFLATCERVVVGACVVQPRERGVHELMSIAVHPAHQRRGHGAAMLRWVIEHFRSQGARRLEVGTGSFGYQLAFYQRHGFRVAGIDRDFFIRNYPGPILEDGIQLFDMLRLALTYPDAQAGPMTPR